VTGRQIRLEDLKPIKVRVEISADAVARYAEAMAEGVKFPAVEVMEVGGDLIVTDGWHRLRAAQDAGVEIGVNTRKGTMSDAIRAMVEANGGTRGLPLTRADRRHGVELLLDDPKLVRLSDRAIAKIAGVHHSTIASIRAQLANSSTDASQVEDPQLDEDLRLQTDRRIGRDGKLYKAVRPQPPARVPSQAERTVAEMTNMAPAPPVTNGASELAQSDTPPADGMSSPRTMRLARETSTENLKLVRTELFWWDANHAQIDEGAAAAIVGRLDEGELAEWLQALQNMSRAAQRIHAAIATKAPRLAEAWPFEPFDANSANELPQFLNKC
jgi:hypothetical protein